MTTAVLDRAIQVLDSVHANTLSRSCSSFNTNEATKSRLITYVNSELKSLGQRIAFARNRKDMSQPELARRVGVRQSTIGNIESGARKRPQRLLEIADALGVTQQWILTGALPMDASPPDHLSVQEVRAIYGAEGLSEIERVLVQLFRQSRPTVQQRLLHELITEVGPDKDRRTR